MLIQDFLIKSAKRFPNKEALIHTGKRYTYSDILDASSAISNWLLSRNLQPGFRAAILTDDPFEYVTSYFAIINVNGIVVGLNTQTSERTLKTVLNDCKASFIFINIKFKRCLDKIAPSIPSVNWAIVGGFKAEISRINDLELVDREDILTTGHKYDSGGFDRFSSTDIAQIIYTSGTTGEPKGVMLSHLNLVANTNSIVEYLGLTEDDRVMAVLPFFYSYGNSILLTHIAVGGTLVVNQSFMYPNVILDEMVNEKVTGFSGVPSTYAILLNRSAIKKYSFPFLRYITQAGAAMAPNLVQRLKEIFPDVDIYIMYGQTEASARLSYLDPEEINRKAGSIGKAIPGVNLQLLDKTGRPVQVGEIGEIVATGDNIMAGYWQKPEETAQVLRPEGLWTGDLATMDEQGYLFIKSRKNDIIKSGSHRIGPKEIEDIILEHEAVHETAVLGIEDEILG